MNPINSPPIMSGIDSLHLQVEATSREFMNLLFFKKLHFQVIKQNKWNSKLKIFFIDEIILVTLAKGKATLEFGGLYYNKNSRLKLQLLKKFTQWFITYKIKRIDFACDLKIQFNKISTNTPNQFNKYQNPQWDSFYFNKNTKQRTMTYIIYDRSKRISLFSFPVTRIEIRLFKSLISNRHLENLLSSAEALHKVSKLIEKLLTKNLSVKVGSTVIQINLDVRSILENFVLFLQSDMEFPTSKDIFHLQEAFISRDKLLKWMNNNNTCWKTLPAVCKKMKQTNICEQVGISKPTLRKALKFAKSA